MRFSCRMVCAAIVLALIPLVTLSDIGREVAISQHLQDGEEFQLSIPNLIAFGEKLFTARWTIQEGGGRPLAFEALSPYDRDCLIKFLKTLEVLPPQTSSPVVDENGRPKMQSHGSN